MATCGLAASKQNRVDKLLQHPDPSPASPLKQGQMTKAKSHTKDDGIGRRPMALRELEENHVCIDGGVYDINSFTHPGGDQIFLFGGNDVTVQYKMIHPYHSYLHLKRMKQVGILTDFACEYEFDSAFARDIKKQVRAVVPQDHEFATNGYTFRMLGYLILFFYAQYQWITTPTLTVGLAIAFGVCKALIGLNVQHDANHGAISRQHPWLNEILGFGADWIGGNKWLWQQHHWTHHAYTNHCERDPDTYLCEPLLLFHDYPKDHIARQRRQGYQQWQAFFCLPLFCLYWLSSILNTHIIALQFEGASQANLNFDNAYIRRRRTTSMAIRAAYLAVNVLWPVYRHGWRTAVGYILLLGASGSLALALPFALSHNFESSNRHPTTTTTAATATVTSTSTTTIKPTLYCCWMTSQVTTSCTYGGCVAGWLTGGLNYQIEHHLFPRMNSAWYPTIAPIVRRVCAQHNVPYRYYPTIWHNMRSTLMYLHQVGTGANHLQDKVVGEVVVVPKRTQPSLAARYTCASLVVAMLAVWAQWAFVSEDTELKVGADLHSFRVPLIRTTVYLACLPLLRQMYKHSTIDMSLLLRESMIVYNVAQVLLNGWIICRIGTALVWYHHPWVGGSPNLVESGVTYAVWIHYCDKYLEFLDTSFMMLRGKVQQVSFLHVYHHVSIAWAWWAGLCLAPGGDIYFGAICNSTIHVAMYSYYTLALWKLPCPWKKHLTMAQLWQFASVLFYSSVSYMMRSSPVDWRYTAALVIQCTEMTSLLLLFVKFYSHTYKRVSTTIGTPMVPLPAVVSLETESVPSADSDSVSSHESIDRLGRPVFEEN